MRRAALAAILTLAAASDSQAQSLRDTSDAPALVRANEIQVDDDLGWVVARGQVEISQGDRLLKADTLTYNRRTNVVTASGGVMLLDPAGDVAFADFVELTSDMRDGTIRNLRAMLTDQSRFAAVTARRADGSKTVMRRATYSPCEPCEKDPTRAPMWQLRAERITHDKAAKEISYDNAWLEVAGVPVAYTPYIAHPDGTEKRKSGFLIPDISSSSKVGTMVATPYYWTLGPSADMTVTPIVLTNDLPILAGEYREHARNGKVQFNGALMRTRREGEGFGDTRGYASGKGRFDIDADWRWGFDFARATDKTFLDRYRLRQRFAFLNQDVFESRLYTEGFRDRGYAVLQGLSFQGLRPEDSLERSPQVLPAGAYSWTGEPGAMGGRFGFDANTVSIYRRNGVRTQRASAVGGWTLPYTTRTGEVYTVSATVQTDIFNTDNIDTRGGGYRPTENGFQSRVLPQLGVSWSYPLVRSNGAARLLVEPVAGAFAAPNLGDQRNLPNEDSLGLTFDDTNLLRPNRFTGYDRAEGGVRTIYGLNSEYSNVWNQRFGAFLGQQFRYKSESAAPAGSGIDTRFSDITGRFNATPHPWLSTSYRFQIDNASRELLRSVTSASLGPTALRYSLSHSRLDRALQPTALVSVNQLGHGLSAAFDENWRIQGRVIQALGNDSGILIAGATLFYEDDCFIWGIDFTRRNIGRDEIPPDTAILFRIALRNLGELSLRGL
ncbi:MAG: LPS-assembly protein LptD [Rhodospirillales bacterium]